jgi:hypothetical protein
MNKTQRVVSKKQNEVSVGLRAAGSHDPLKVACFSRRTRMGAAVFVALAPVSLLAVSQVSSAALVDNLANVSNERARGYSSQVREALSAVAPAAGASGAHASLRRLPQPMHPLCPMNSMYPLQQSRQWLQVVHMPIRLLQSPARQRLPEEG